MLEILSNQEFLIPFIFAGIMVLAMLLYTILDGYDLGVGMLMAFAKPDEKDKMIAAIGPFWDANETWLVLAIGLLLTAFPVAHGLILTHLYLPVFVMLIALILRGVAFDFRTKAVPHWQKLWNNLFSFGSLLAALSQGYMLGLFIMGFEHTGYTVAFSLFCGVCLAAGYILLGSCWLIIKLEGGIQKKMKRFAIYALWTAFSGIIIISFITPMINEEIFDKWFSYPSILWLSPIPLISFALVIYCNYCLDDLLRNKYHREWTPFLCSIGIFVMGFVGLGYSFFPYIIPGKLTIWQAASGLGALKTILWGAAIVVPCIICYTIFSYWVFRGKVKELEYY
jgi:cytochrome bd ubiquinol oxidase subunit II